MNRFPVRAFTALVAGIGLFSMKCATSDVASNRGGHSMSGDVLARFGDQEVTLAAFDGFLAAQPEFFRAPSSQPADDRLIVQLQEFLMQQRLLKEARAAHIPDDPRFRGLRQTMERRAILQNYVISTRPELLEVSEPEIKDAYEAERHRFEVPERRACYHLMRRIDTSTDRDTALAALADARVRLMRGESLQEVATTCSDSEARHRQGHIGWVQRGMLGPAFEQIIFSLEERVPSEPVVVDHAAHLFVVDTVLPARTLSLDEVRVQLAQHIQRVRLREFVQQTAANVVLPSDAEFLTQEELKALIPKADPQSPCLKIADTVVTLGDLWREAHADHPTSQTPITVEQLWTTFEALRDRVLVAYHCRAEGLIDLAEISEQVAVWERNTLIQEQRQRVLTSLADEDEPRLRQFYESNVGQFSRPERVKLSLLRIPVDEHAAQTMADLEAAVQGGASELKPLKGEAGELMELDWKTLDEIARVEPKLPALLSPMTTQGLTAPFRSGAFIIVARIREREPPAPIPFETARPTVAAAFAEQYKASLYQKLQMRWFPKAEIAVNPDALARLSVAGMPQEDISVESIEELLEELESTP